MSQKRCCVPGCNVTITDGVPLHRFPDPVKDADRFSAWVTNTGGEISLMDVGDIHINKRVCRRHFEPCYLYPSNRLCRLAVPNLHMPALQNTMEIEPVAQSSSLVALQKTMEIEPVAESSSSVALQKTMEIEPVAQSSSSLALQKTMEIEPVAQSSSSVAVHPIMEEPSTSSTSMLENSSEKSVLNCAHTHNMTSLASAYKTLVKEVNALKRLSKQKLPAKKLQKKLEKSEALKTLTKDMPEAAQLFFKMQITQKGKSKRGRRFSVDEKVFALSLYKPAPKAYRLLSTFCVLPSRRTLQNLLNKINLKPGLNEKVFKHLKKRVNKMPEHHKYCSIVFDEMAIGPGLNYHPRNDQIVGFVDNGSERKLQFCDHVLVFMIRGVVKKFKQPISYTFCAGSTKTYDLKKQIIEIIKEVQKTGLKVVATVCDQGASNVAAINELLRETREDYIKKGEQYSTGFFEIEKEKIFPIFDPPHLIKGIRNNLVTKNLKYVDNNKTKTAKWSHIVELYNRSPGYSGVKLVPKLTAQHVMPHLIPKMRVKHCTQVFSKSVGVAMGYMTECGRLPKESCDTADTLFLFDDLFDSVNGSSSRLKGGKVYRTAVTPTSPHHRLWNKTLPILKTMKFVKNSKEVCVPSLVSWVKTIEGFKLICKHLYTKGVNSLLLRNFNQDALENFFGAIRAHGYRNVMPTASAFEASFKTLLVNNMTSSHSVGANCERDNSKCLQSLKYFLTEDAVELQKIDEHELHMEDVDIDQLDTQMLIEGKTLMQVEKSAAIGYCSGWLAQSLKKIYGKCEYCTHNLIAKDEQSFHKIIKLKEYENKQWLCYPTRALFDFFANVEHITIELLRKRCNKVDLLSYISFVVDITIDSSFLTCPTHKDQLLKQLQNKSIKFFIMNWCKDVNSVLMGKTTFWDTKDDMKNAAHNHFLKNKGRNRR